MLPLGLILIYPVYNVEGSLNTKYMMLNIDEVVGLGFVVALIRARL